MKKQFNFQKNESYFQVFFVSVPFLYCYKNDTDKDKSVFFLVHLFKSDALCNTDLKSVRRLATSLNQT